MAEESSVATPAKKKSFLRIAGWGCGSIVLVFIALAVVLGVLAEKHEAGWRRVKLMNTLERPLQVGVEYEDGEKWMATTVEPHSSAYFKVKPGKVRAIVVEEDGTVFRRGDELIELLPDEQAPEHDEVLIDAKGEGQYAIVDAFFLYEASTGLGKAMSDAMNQGRKTVLAAMPADDVMVWNNGYQGSLFLPGEELPERAQAGSRNYLVHAVPSSAKTTKQIVDVVVHSFAEKE